MAAPGQKSFCVLEYHTSKSVVTVHFVQSTQRTRLQTRPFVRGINSLLKLLCLCKQKSSGHPLTAEDDVERVWASFLHSPKKSLVVKKKKNFSSFPVAVNNSIKVGPLVFLLQMFVIMQDIMKRPVFITILVYCLLHTQKKCSFQ